MKACNGNENEIMDGESGIDACNVVKNKYENSNNRPRWHCTGHMLEYVANVWEITRPIT